MTHRNNPLLGDPAYGGRLKLPKAASPELREALQDFPRQALHARTLAFQHPATGDDCTFETPLPDDMLQLLAVLRTFDAMPP